MEKKKTVLMVADAACPSGFAQSTHHLLEHILPEYEPYVLGINYRGDPHSYPYRIWAASPGGDYLGVGRLVWMCDIIYQETGAPPDVIVLQNDGWHIQAYMNQLRVRHSNGEYAWPEYAAIPVVVICAVDGKNFQAKWLDGVTHTIFWTEFALNEAREAGFTGQASVIPLGVDLDIYKPMDKTVARRSRGFGQIEDAFIIGNVNRNQPRKRWDLLIRYFAEWVYGGKPRQLRTGLNMKIQDAYLGFHIAPTGDNHVNVKQLCEYYGVASRFWAVQPPEWYGVPEKVLAEEYNCFDLVASTTQGEGFGLTVLEAMACGVPVVVPEWSALGEWPRDAAWLVPCTSTACTVTGGMPLNVIGGIPDEALFIAALNFLYHNREALAQNGRAALERAQQSRFRWENIGQRVFDVLNAVTTPVQVEVTA